MIIQIRPLLSIGLSEEIGPGPGGMQGVGVGASIVPYLKILWGGPTQI